MNFKTRMISLLTVISIPLLGFAQPSSPANNQPDQILLPDNFSVYTNGSAVINHPMEGFQKKTLPTNNDYKQSPGCYIACYSDDKNNGIYPVGKDVYVNGQVRVAGAYQGTMCIPTGYENKDLSKEDSLKVQCAKISTCTSNQCWAGGDTGGWYGIQP